MEDIIEIACKCCKDIFIFGSSNAIENATFCCKKCEVDNVLNEYYKNELNEDDDIDIAEEELLKTIVTFPENLPEIGIMYVVIDTLNPLSMGFACSDKKQTMGWVERTNQLLGKQRFIMTKRKWVDANILQCDNIL